MTTFQVEVVRGTKLFRYGNSAIRKQYIMIIDTATATTLPPSEGTVLVDEDGSTGLTSLILACLLQKYGLAQWELQSEVQKVVNLI